MEQTTFFASSDKLSKIGDLLEKLNKGTSKTHDSYIVNQCFKSLARKNNQTLKTKSIQVAIWWVFRGTL
jgi:hypothetical protein